MSPLQVGDHVTVIPGDPAGVEIGLHAHVVIVAVEPGPTFVVAHPPAPRRFGPYPADRLMRGWVNPR